MDSTDKRGSEEIIKFRQELAALRRRLRANAKKSKNLSSDTEILLKKIKPEE
jgi:hypothetical protein